MPQLYKHKVGGWRIVYKLHFPAHQPKQKTKYARKLQDAQRILGDVDHLEMMSRKRQLTKDELVKALNFRYVTQEEAAMLHGSDVGVHITWQKLRKEYEGYSRKNSTGYTHVCNMKKLTPILGFFEDYIPTAITKETVTAYIDKRFRDKVLKGKPDKNGQKREETVKSSTIEKEINILRILLDPLGPENPARKVSPPKRRDERIPRPLWREDIKTFYNALRLHQRHLYGYLRPLAMTYLYAGLRPTELINLRPADINLKIGKIFVQGKDDVRTKTGGVRSIEIHPKLIVYIESCLKKGGKYLFGGEARIDPKSVSRAIRRVMEGAGLVGVTPYSLRHTFITGLLRSGADLREAMDRAGHRRLATTTRYLHVSPTKNPVKRIRFKD